MQYKCISVFDWTLWLSVMIFQDLNVAKTNLSYTALRIHSLLHYVES